MRLAIWGLGVILLLAALLRILSGVPAVQDRIIERALSRAIATDPYTKFDGDGLKVVFCGTSSPIASAKRAQTCTAIIAGEKFFLVDAGTGSWRVVQQAGLPGDRLEAIFLTHFHSDHIGDLSEANLGSWVLGRPAPLAVYGPEGVASVVDGVNAAFALDNSYRTAHHGKAIAPPRTAGLTPVTFNAETATPIYNEHGLVVTAFRVDHEPADPSVAYRFDYQGRSVFVSGDTSYIAALANAARDVDLLIHEAQANHIVAKMQAAAANAGRANLAKILSDIPDYHTTPVEVAQLANDAGADWLVMNHLTPPPDNPILKRAFLRGVKDVRPSGVKLAEDGMTVSLPADGGVHFSKN